MGLALSSRWFSWLDRKEQWPHALSACAAYHHCIITKWAPLLVIFVYLLHLSSVTAFFFLAAKGLNALALSSVRFYVKIFIEFSADKWPTIQVLVWDSKQHQTFLLGNFQEKSLAWAKKLMGNWKAKMEVWFSLQISSVVFIVPSPFEQCNLFGRKGEDSHSSGSCFWGIYPRLTTCSVSTKKIFIYVSFHFRFIFWEISVDETLCYKICM